MTGCDLTVVVDQSDFVIAHHPGRTVRGARGGSRLHLYIHPVDSQYTGQRRLSVWSETYFMTCR